MEIRNHVLEFSNEIKRKGYRDQSVKNYVSCVEKFLNHFIEKPQPKAINEYDIKIYLSQFKEHNTNALTTEQSNVLQVRDPATISLNTLSIANGESCNCVSVEEIQKLFNACSNLKHRYCRFNVFYRITRW